MPHKKTNLCLCEALDLRNEYDRHIDLLQILLGEPSKKHGLFREDDEEKEPVTDFDHKSVEEKLKKLQFKRVKLNHEVQTTNFETQIELEGEKISITEALEKRKNLLADIKAIAERVEKASYRRVIHKEGRDIIQEPRHRFSETYKEYQDSLRQLRKMINQIHVVNHTAVVNFKDE